MKFRWAPLSESNAWLSPRFMNSLLQGLSYGARIQKIDPKLYGKP
jgi:hypothetical protein